LLAATNEDRSMEDALILGLLAAYAGLILLDFIAPGRAFPRIRYWRLKGFASFVINLMLFMSLPFVWDGWLGQYRLIDLTQLGVAAGSLVAIVVAQLFSYVWHRSMHNVDFLWRWFHQMHHSAERVDVFGAYYFSPFDVLGFAFVGSLALVLCVGVQPEAALIANMFVMFCAMFQHANLRTPRWLGYFIQRPENHALHHERGVHAYNYGDIPLWDMVFGTFKNPERWDGKAGFYDGASQRVGAMLAGRDVSGVEPAPAPRNSGVPAVADAT
jgi:sterol desaturase/sphingolipid hydroxylase (fatty acid hydroxylase superfamily)